MNPSNSALANTLHTLLAQAPSLTAAQLQAATGKSQPSISLALHSLGAQVHKLGAARSTRYALAHEILGLPAQQLLHLAPPHTDHGVFGQLTLLHNSDVHVRGPRRSEWLGRNALPWFLSGLRPQGFLGRQYTLLRPDFPADPDDWSVTQVLYMAANHMTDPPGAFALGAHQMPADGSSHWVSTEQQHTLAKVYDQLAQSAARTLPMGSSAGGEQPKFTVRLQAAGGSAEQCSCIVKFSPPRGTPFGERWHDLLQLEHLANEVLRSYGVASAHTQLVYSPQRTYLQSERFDRLGDAGKRHVVAASAVHDEFVKTPRQHWVATCQALLARHLLSAADLNTVALTYLFGQYIANTDMHFGNLSFFVDDVMHPQLMPTPVYDMLPMQWRPHAHTGLLDAEPVRPQRPPPGFAAQAEQARHWAIDYWQRAASMGTLSGPTRTACEISVKRLQDNFAGMML